MPSNGAVDPWINSLRNLHGSRGNRRKRKNRKPFFLYRSSSELMLAIRVKKHHSFELLGFVSRYDWYQTEKYVTVTVFAKGVQKEDLEVAIQDKKVCVCDLHLHVFVLVCNDYVMHM